MDASQTNFAMGWDRASGLLAWWGIPNITEASGIESRKVEYLRADYPHEAFKRVTQVSELNETLYRLFVSPWVQTFANPWTAEMLKWLHPMRTSRYLLSDAFCPWMRGVAMMAAAVAKTRAPLPHDHQLLEWEREAIGKVAQGLENARKGRDATCERAFDLLYGDAIGQSVKNG